MKRSHLTIIFIALLSATAISQTAEKEYKKCDDAFNNSKYSDAVKYCSKALNASADHLEARLLRAAANEKLRNDRAAIEDYTQLIGLTNGMPMVHFYRAEIYSKTPKSLDAISDYSIVIEKDPTGRYAARSHYQRGLIYDELGRSDDAQADYWRAVKIDPNFTEAKKKVKYPFGDKTITEAAENIFPTVTPSPRPERTPAAVKPLPAPTVAVVRATPTPTIVKPTPRPTPVSVPATPKRTPTPIINKPKPSRIPIAVRPTPKPTTIAKPSPKNKKFVLPITAEPEFGNTYALPYFRKGRQLLRSNKPDLAISEFQTALSKLTMTGNDDFIAILVAIDRGIINEQIGAAYLMKGDADKAIAIYKSTLDDCFKKLNSGFVGVSKKQPKSYGQFMDSAKVLMDVDIAMYSMYHGSALRIDALGKRILEILLLADLTNEQSMSTLSIGILKIAAAETSSMLFQTTAELNLAVGSMCKVRAADICGPRSKKNEVNSYGQQALKDMNNAVMIASGIKTNYATRAKVYRYLGRDDLAIADEKRASEK